MNLHEYQAKSLLRGLSIPVPRGIFAFTPRQAEKAAVNLGGKSWVVKAQVLTGGRGKAGGVKLGRSRMEVFDFAKEMLGKRLVSVQSGPAGVLVRRVLVEEAIPFSQEFYISFVIDRARKSVVVAASGQGGMEIEEVAAARPDAVKSLPVPWESGLHDFHCREIGYFLGLERDKQAAFASLLELLYGAFLKLDALMLEVNPLVLTDMGDFCCLDTKLSIDDNALFRQREAFEAIDYDEMDEREIRAADLGISYVPLGGNIGCMVNGAGLAMATADLIQQAGGEPANFLDVGGGATEEMVREAFKLILQDEAVKGVLVNIFGGIMHCDVIAAGIIEAAKSKTLDVPVVVRLSGTNVEQGREMLKASGLPIVAVDELETAAATIVQAVRG